MVGKGNLAIFEGSKSPKANQNVDPRCKDFLFTHGPVYGANCYHFLECFNVNY